MISPRTLLFIEHDNHKIHHASLCALNACQALGNHITTLVIGKSISHITKQLTTLMGVDAIIQIHSEHLDDSLAENIAPMMMDLAPDFSHIVGNASTNGKNILLRLAGLLDVMPITDVTAIVDTETFERPVYGDNAISTIKSSDMRKIITIRTTAFKPANHHTKKHPSKKPVKVTKYSNIDNSAQNNYLSQVIERKYSASLDLDNAKIIVSGGRGVGSKANYDTLLRPLATKLNAALGASRPAVDKQFCPNDYLVGQTSKIVAPNVYFAIGISGEIQHINGIKDSRCIVAINNNPHAKIFRYCDYGLIVDLNEFILNLINKL